MLLSIIKSIHDGGLLFTIEEQWSKQKFDRHSNKPSPELGLLYLFVLLCILLDDNIKAILYVNYGTIVLMKKYFITIVLNLLRRWFYV